VSQLLLSSNRERTALLAVFVLFLATRVLTVMSFPIFNDEALYLQYTQRIHDDWDKNKFVSMNGDYVDWKTAFAVLVSQRPSLTSAVIHSPSAAPSHCSSPSWVSSAPTRFTKTLFGKAEALVASALYTLCPTVLFQNNQFTAETFLVATRPCSIGRC
jgi:hypothetical protein